MTRRSSRGLTVAVRQGVFGVALGLPLLASPLLAQEAPAEPAAVDVEVEQTETQTVEVDPGPDGAPVVTEEETITETETVIEQPRVLISEVLIEGISGHPEEERLQVAAYDAMQVRPGTLARSPAVWKACASAAARSP